MVLLKIPRTARVVAYSRLLCLGLPPPTVPHELVPHLQPCAPLLCFGGADLGVRRGVCSQALGLARLSACRSETSYSLTVPHEPVKRAGIALIAGGLASLAHAADLPTTKPAEPKPEKPKRRSENVDADTEV